MGSPPVNRIDHPPLRANDRLVVLVNPAARSTGDRVAIADAVRTLKRRYRIDVVSPVGLNGLVEAAREAAASSDALIVAGGDGTLHRVINAVQPPSVSETESGDDHPDRCARIGSDDLTADASGVPIGLLPIGTGNDFARAMRLPTGPAAAATQILDGRIKQIDLVAVNNRVFCTVGVFGLAAEATIAFDRLQRPGSWTRPLMRVLGGWSYRIAGLQALINRGSRLEGVTIEAPGGGPITVLQSQSKTRPVDPDHEPVDGAIGASAPRATYGAFVTNTTLLGGGMTVPVDSDMADGQLEIACIEPVSLPRLQWAFLCLANGWRVPDDVLRVIRIDRAVITCGRRLPFAADGEVVCEESRFDVAVRPGALRVIS